ncbi:unnamed protein product [Trichogramma brassicae]|uniref:Complex I assembly factor TIMMDC1, mitochondrial n=1 Tax=Trichogramma brassicae TaxID=86971 RepID=A0A6H5IZL3_9HYME|nr:unnamed protein product [Trichogramma brassicae]
MRGWSVLVETREQQKISHRLGFYALARISCNGCAFAGSCVLCMHARTSQRAVVALLVVNSDPVRDGESPRQDRRRRRRATVSPITIPTPPAGRGSGASSRSSEFYYLDFPLAFTLTISRLASSKDYTFHPDLVNVVQTAVFSYIVGGLYGGVMRSRETFIKFIENNEATQFRSHLDAKRQLSDKMFIALMKGANTWGPKVTFFTVTYT